MSRMNLDNIKLVVSPLSDTIYMARFGKDPQLALDKREAEWDVMSALVQHMMYDAPNGSEKVISFGDDSYLIRVQPVEKEDIQNEYEMDT